MMFPSVTVVIPAYNAVQYLGETLDSVLCQTYQDFEVLVVDDGSTDETQALVQSRHQRDSRIKLITQENSGVSTARNTGIKQAMGEYIAFLDADDIWHPEKLATHLKHLNEDESLGVSYGRVEFIREDSTTTGRVANVRLKDLKPVHLYVENPACTPSNMVVRRLVFEDVNGFDPNLSGLADIEFCLKIACAGWKVEGLEKVLVKYRIVSASMSSQLEKMEQEWNDFSKLVYVYAPDLVCKHYQRAKAVFLRYIARRALRSHPNPHVSFSFINRAVLEDWKIIFREPKRTALTWISSCIRALFQLNTSVFE